VELPRSAPRWVMRIVEHIGSGFARSLAHIDLPKLPEGWDQKGNLPVVFIGNHRSMFDVFIGMRMMRRWNAPARMMVKGDFFDKPVSGQLLRLLGAIPVTSGRGAKLAFDQAAEALRAGESVIIMPEARVVPTDERPLGTADLVATLGRLVAIRPCVVAVTGLIGADEVWAPFTSIPTARPWRRGLVRIRCYVQHDLHELNHRTITAQLQTELRGIVNRMEGRMENAIETVKEGVLEAVAVAADVTTVREGVASA
jgi:Acyltransferase